MANALAAHRVIVRPAHPQARAIGDRQGGLMLEAARGIEQALHLGHGQYDGDLANLLGADQLAREIGTIERMGK